MHMYTSFVLVIRGSSTNFCYTYSIVIGVELVFKERVSILFISDAFNYFAVFLFILRALLLTLLSSWIINPDCSLTVKFYLRHASTYACVY